MDRFPRRLLADLAAAAAFAALVLLYTWPLAARLTTHTIGFAADSSMWMWDLWHFRRAVQTGANPLWTDAQYWPYGANLVLHHYGLFYDFLGYALLPRLGLIATYDLLVMANLLLAAIFVYALARAWGARPAAAFVGGAAYAFSSYSTVTLRTGVGLEYMSIQMLPLFFALLARAARRRGLLDALYAALALTALWGCNYYYFCFCLLLIPLVWATLERPVALRVEARPDAGVCALARRALRVPLAGFGLWALVSIARGQVGFGGRGSARELLAYVAPYLLFWASAAAAAAARWRVRATPRREAFGPRALAPYAGVVGLWTLLNAPMIAAVLHWLSNGENAAPPKPWRGGGNPTDLAALLLPGPYHPFFGGLTGRLPGVAGSEHSSLSLVMLALAWWLWRRRDRADVALRLWFAGFAASFLVCLGPWLKVFGVHLYLLLPFYAIHLLPVYDNLQVGFRLSVFAHLFLALLVAAALTRLSERLKGAARAVLPWAVFALIAVESWPAPWPLYDARVPPILTRLGARPDGAILPVPFGALFDSMGVGMNVGRVMMAMHHQSEHRKPYVGGALGRVSAVTARAVRADRFLMDLAAAQDGAPLAARLTDARAVGDYLTRGRLRYVLVRDDLVPPALAAVVARWPVKLIDREDHYLLYETAVPGGRHG